MSSDKPVSIPLPSRSSSDKKSSPVWSLTNHPPDAVPLPSKCDREHPTREGVCCKTLKEEERTLIDPDIVRDVIIGLSDGLTVPFALTAGLSSLGTSRLVIIGGVSELIAGAISMGIGGFLASQAERDHYRFLRRATSHRVLRSCDGEMEREVYDILGPVGVDEKTSRAVADCLRRIEVDSAGEDITSTSSTCPESGMRLDKNVGLSGFLLKFGENLEEVPTRRLYISAFTIGMGYLLGGIVPLIPYFCEPVAHKALVWSCVVTGIILLIFGVVKARVTGAGRNFGTYLWGALTTLAVGGSAAAAAYGLVAVMQKYDK
ncbi:VIT family-domain-containing protein [Sparassis latifolia]